MFSILFQYTLIVPLKYRGYFLVCFVQRGAVHVHVSTVLPPLRLVVSDPVPSLCTGTSHGPRIFTFPKTLAVYSCALSEMDNSSFCFNLCCVNPVFARIYVRAAYGIMGTPGWDVCAALCPCTCLCSACQVHHPALPHTALNSLAIGAPLCYGVRSRLPACAALGAPQVYAQVKQRGQPPTLPPLSNR